MELVVYNIKGEQTARKVTLNEGIFNVEPNDHAIYLDTKQYLANQRQGTGGARGGSIKSPLLRGGARVFGPHPRDYSFKLNKKLKKLARISALSYKALENNILVLEDFKFETPKTKQFIELLSNLKLNGKKTLMVLADVDKIIVLSSRNLSDAKIIRACDLNTYDILRASNLIILESSLTEIEKTLSN
jgi:large subunit ribosomal protein L4